jgi:uncharacterized membrane protein YdjX (TVP38/TMEM64 family)
MKKLWIALALVALLLALRFSGLGEWLSFDTLVRHRLTLSAWVSSHPLLSAGAFVAIYTVVAALALPGAVWLTLGGGFLFGAALGTALTVAGATMGATLLFLFAQRVFGADALQKLGPKAEGLARGIQANAWSYLLVLRLVPLFPFFLVNLVPAFCGVRPAVFIVTTALGIIPGTAVFALSGAGLGRVLDAGGTPSLSGILTPEIIAALCGLAALALLAIPLKKRFSASG